MKKARMIVNIAMTVVLLCLMASLKHYKKIIEDMESYNGFYAREERTYTNLVPQIEKMI